MSGARSGFKILALQTPLHAALLGLPTVVIHWQAYVVLPLGLEAVALVQARAAIAGPMAYLLVLFTRTWPVQPRYDTDFVTHGSPTLAL